LFCLGDIRVSPDSTTDKPWKPTVVDAKPLDAPTVIATPAELDEALADLAKQRVMWIQLTKDQVGEARRKQLEGWVVAGGVLWIDTELGRDFGFRLLKTSEAQVRGQAMVGKTEHPILDGLTPETVVNFVLSPSAVTISGESRDLSRGMTPLVGWPAEKGRARVVLAVRNQGRGYVIFRPREFAADETGKRLEQNLRAWTFKVAPPVKPEPKADADKDKPTRK